MCEWSGWMGDTPKTVMTTRAPAVPKKTENFPKYMSQTSSLLIFLLKVSLFKRISLEKSKKLGILLV